MLDSADCATRLSFLVFFFFSKTRAFVSLPDRDLSARWA